MYRLAVFAITLTTLSPLVAQRVVPYGLGVPLATIGRINDLLVWDGKLVVAGRYGSLMGAPVENIGSWDGAQVQTYPGAFAELIASEAIALEEFNGQLVVAGRDNAFGGVARWDGTQWLAFDQGYPGAVRALVMFNGVPVVAGDNGAVAQWNTTTSTWDTLGVRIDGSIAALEVYQGELYAGGAFIADANGVEMRCLAHWNGTAWEQVLNGFDDRVWTLCATADGLAIGGNFTADGDGAQALPYWTVFDGTSFSTPGFAAPFGVRYIGQLPGGDLLMRAGSGYIVHGDTAVAIPYDPACMTVYEGAVLMGNSTGFDAPTLGEWTTTGLAQLLREGQHFAQLDRGGLNATVSPTPALFEKWWVDAQSAAGLEAPKGDTTYIIYSASPWLLAKQGGAWHSSAPAYNNSSVDSAAWAGPQADVQDTAYYHRYHQVWTIDQGTIDVHAEHWSDPWYSMPWSIRSWPGNGNTANGEPAQLAPFRDMNGDGVYEPSAGDHPLIRGDQAAYWILHGEPDEDTGMDPMRFDMHVLAYTFSDPVEGLDRYNSLFLNFRSINRSGAAYDSVRFAFCTDFDLGGYEDDLIACDSTRNLFLVYNADDMDGDLNGTQGYGTQPPAAGIQFLNHPMTAHRAWRSAEFDTLAFTDIMNGLQTGSPFMQLGYPTHFQYPGGAWTDTVITITPDRRAAGSVGPFTWGVEDTLCFDLAVLFARAPSGGPIASVAALEQRADAVQTWYDGSGIACGSLPDVVSVPEIEWPTFALAPNPAQDVVRLSAPAGAAATVVLYDATGHAVLRQAWPANRPFLELDISGLMNGAYLVEYLSPHGRNTVRLIKLEH